MDEATRKQLEDLRRAYESGVLPQDTYEAMIKQLGGTIVQTEGDHNIIQQAGGALVSAVDDSTAVGGNIEGDLNQFDINQKVGTNSGRVTGVHQGDAITGDKNVTQDNRHITYIIQQTSQGTDNVNLRQEIGRYLDWLTDNTRTIELRGIKREGQQVVQLDLETVYVPLTAVAKFDDLKDSTKPEDYESNIRSYLAKESEIEIPLDQVLNLDKHLIITGGPGCGKTTVLLHIAWALATALHYNNPQLVADKLGLTKDVSLPLPIFAPLSAYAAYRRRLPANTRPEETTLAAFISRYMIENQASFNLPENFFQQLLQQGEGVILLLDGLDEVPNESERVMVRRAIEQLVDGRDNLQVVVTCRTAAYEGRVALGRGFREIKVQPLDKSHITQLITQAYQAIYPTDLTTQFAKRDELLRGIEKMEAQRRRLSGRDDDPLVSSPLLVRMLLVVHYSERHLPEQRAELYMKATEAMLLPEYNVDEIVAEEIGRLVGGNLDIHRELVQYLAFQMYQRGDKQGREIQEFDLKKILREKRYDEALIRDFTSLTRARGTLMEERLEMYRFIHLAFQEFMVARYLAEIVRSESGIGGMVSFLEDENRLLESWWREPILLIAGYLSVKAAPSIAESFIYRLAALDAGAHNRPLLSQPMQWAAAELAATAVLEWPTAADTFKKAVAQRLADLVVVDDTSAVPARLRADLGMALGRLGDPRPGVGVRADGLPDIVWSEVVPAGTYTIGGDSKAFRSFELKEVMIDQPYQLSIYPVTYAQFQSFIEAQDVTDKCWWEIMPGEDRTHLIGQVGKAYAEFPNHPRVNVTWYQATAFCLWLSDKLDLDIRLPHEHQWEVAAKFNDDNDVRKYPWGDEFDEEKANSRASGLGQTTAVGLYPQGRNIKLRLYDMSGNIWEWSRNKYENRAMETVDDSGALRVLRGGSFLNRTSFVPLAFRLDGYPDFWSNHLGFRLCVVAEDMPISLPLDDGTETRGHLRWPI